MGVVFHPRVLSYLSSIMDYYERVATRELADDFYGEFRAAVKENAAKPKSVSLRKGAFRRVNLRRVPYHFLFRIAGEGGFWWCAIITAARLSALDESKNAIMLMNLTQSKLNRRSDCVRQRP